MSVRLPKLRPGPLYRHKFEGTDIDRQSAEEKRLRCMIEQKFAIDTVLRAFQNPLNHNCFFADGPGGTSKTYVHHFLKKYLFGQNKTVLPVVLTGIAACF